MSKIEISVVMAVHNCELSYLKESIESILNQSYKNFELVVVDDINNKSVTTYLSQLVESNKKVTLIRNNKNIGLTKSLIIAVNAARGEYIARQDSDDISNLNRLKAQMEYLHSNPKTVLLGTSYNIIYKENNVAERQQPLTHKDIIRAFLSSNPFIHTSVIFSKEIYIKIGGYNKFCKYSQDFDLWPKFIRYGLLANLPDVLVSRRLNTNSVSMKFRSNIYQSFIGAKVRFRERELFDEKYLILKIFLLAIKQHLSLYINLIRLKKK